MRLINHSAISLSGIIFLLLASIVQAQQTIRIELGDFRFTPDKIHVPAGAQVELELVNTDTLTPHDFVLKAPEIQLDMIVNVPPRKTVTTQFIVPAWPGVYPFYCSKKLWFFKSHRERGMEGQLIVEAHRP